MAAKGTIEELLAVAQKYRRRIDDEVTDPIDCSEGQLFILRILSLNIEIFFDSFNPDAPKFISAVNEHRKIFADSPDTSYLHAPIDLRNGRCYLVSGIIPKGTLYVGIQLYSISNLPGNHIVDRDMKVSDDGHFEVIVTANEDRAFSTSQAVLKGKTTDAWLIVRQYFNDRQHDLPITVKIELVEGPRNPSYNQFSTRQFDAFFQHQLRLAVPDLDLALANTFEAHATLSALCNETFIRADGTRLFPTLDNRYLCAWLPGLSDSDTVYVIRGRRTDCRFFSICLYNRWLESLDYMHHPVHLTHRKIAYHSDGSFAILIAPDNLGYKNNWLCTTGHSGVYVLTRELLPATEETPPFEVIRTTRSRWQLECPKTTFSSL